MTQSAIVAAATMILLIVRQVINTRKCHEAPRRFVPTTLSKSFPVALELFVGVALFVLLDPLGAGAQPCPPQGQSGSQQAVVQKTKKWPVKVFLAGSQQKKVTLEISQSTIALKQKKGPDQEIPISNVTGVTYDNTWHRKSRGWLHAAEEIDQTPLVLGLYPVAAPLVVAAFAAPFKTTTHFIYISWNDAKASPTEMALEIGKTHYAGILAELQLRTGKPWRNLAEERKMHLQGTKPGTLTQQSVAPNSPPASPDAPEASGPISLTSDPGGADTYPDDPVLLPPLKPAIKDGKVGFIDRTGRMVITPKYDNVSGFSEGLAEIQLGGKWGYIDKTGQMVISPQFEYTSGFHEGLAAVGDFGESGRIDKVGYLDRTGQTVISRQYSITDRMTGDAGRFTEGEAPVMVGGKWGYIDKTGEIVIQPQYKDASGFSEGLAAVQQANNKWGYIDKTGKMVIQPQYLDVFGFSEGLAAIRQANQKWGYIDKTGKMAIAPRYFFARGFSEGLAVVEKGHYKWGYIDKTGRIVIAPRYSRAEDFSEGLAQVRVGDKLGYINKTGLIVIPAQFSDAAGGQFSDGLAHVQTSDKIGYIDKTGKYIWARTQ